MPRQVRDEREELRDALRIAPLLERIDEAHVDGYGPTWKLGRVCVAKDYPGYEIHDLLSDLMPDAAFRKIPFAFPEENLRGFIVALAYAREGDRVYEVTAGWVPVEREHQLDEWLAFLNAQIRASHAAQAARQR